MSRDPAVSDAALTRALGTYTGMVHRVLADPGRWLGLDDDPPPSAGFPVRLVDAARDRAFGAITPASPRWGQQPIDQRVEWWVRRIGVTAGLAAAAPRFAGALADRVPLQATLGASAAGLAVCATAREHGVTTAEDWVPVVAKVLFGRDLSRQPGYAFPPAESEDLLASTDAADEGADPAGTVRSLGRGAQHAARTLRNLARALWDLRSILDERPRGNLLARGLAQLPVVGVAGGWLDERGGIRKAARQTTRALR